MSCGESPAGWRAAAFAAALFAITLNFLQPLAHAALMRDGMPKTLWTVFCNTATADRSADDQGSNSTPSAAQEHECCLGLANAPAFIGPSAAFVTIVFVVARATPIRQADELTPVGIRDGPSQPRGPPFLV